MDNQDPFEDTNDESQVPNSVNDETLENFREQILRKFLEQVNLFMSKNDFINSLVLAKNNNERIKVVKQFFKWNFVESYEKELFRQKTSESRSRQLEDVIVGIQNSTISNEKTENGNDKLNAKVKDEKKRRQLFYDDLFEVKCPNPLVPSVESFVEINSNPIRGRHLIVTKDVPIGTTLLVEKPFIYALDETFKSGEELQHCHHCLKNLKSVTSIKCPNCMFAIFCNEACLMNSSSCHKYECPCLHILQYILNDELTENFYLAFKLICSLGPRKLFQMFKNKDDKLYCKKDGAYSNKQKYVLGCDPKSGIYHSDSYLPIFHLSSTFRPEEGYLFPVISVLLSEILKNCTNFFESIETKWKSDFEIFIAELILHNFESFRRNVYTLGELHGLEGITLEDTMREREALNYQLKSFGSGIFPVASLINHSCVPNSHRFVGHSFGITAIVASRNLKKGEEIVVTYGPSFGYEKLSYRQDFLLKGYNFNCSCIACRNDWPRLTELFPKIAEMKYCCQKCSTKIIEEMKTQKEMLQYLLSLHGNFKCPKCGHRYDKASLKDTNSKFLKKTEVCKDLILNNSPLAAIPCLKSAVEFFDLNFVPPVFPRIVNQEMFWEAVMLIIYYSS